MPAQKQKPPLQYSRTKGRVEITGDPADVKELAQAERWERIIKYFIGLVLLSVLLSKAGSAAPVCNLVEAVLRRLPVAKFIKSWLGLSG